MLNTFSWGGVDSSTFHISCDLETHSILPEQRKFVKEVTGRDGYVDFGIGGYGVRVITLPIYYNDDYSVLRAEREQIIAWLACSNGQPKQLSFSTDTTKYYIAKVYSAISFENTEDRKIGNLIFECNPPWQYENGILLTPEEITWNTSDIVDTNQYMKEFTANGSIRLTNTGTMAIKPIIYLYGHIKSGLLLTYGDFEWQYDADLINDGIKIDCENETVTQLSNGANLFGNVNATKDDYFELSSGQVEISLADSELGEYPLCVTMIVEFNPQNLG